MSQAGKIWLITGASSGIGRSLVKYVMKQGEIVLATFRKESEARTFSDHAGNLGKGYTLNLEKPEQITSVVNQIGLDYGKIDVLVNNAGVGFTGAVEEAGEKELRQIMEINFFGPAALTKAVLPLMREKRNGHILQVSSHAGIAGFAGFGIYSSSKFALEGLSESLAHEVRPMGIRVTIIEPGPFRTGFAGRRLNEAAVIIRDYEETAGVFRQKLRSVDGKQEGDPEAAAAIIYSLTRMEYPPLRQPLGKIALNTIKTKLQRVTKDLETGEKRALQAIFDNLDT